MHNRQIVYTIPLHYRDIAQVALFPFTLIRWFMFGSIPIKLLAFFIVVVPWTLYTDAIRVHQCHTQAQQYRQFQYQQAGHYVKLDYTCPEFSIKQLVPGYQAIPAFEVKR